MKRYFLFVLFTLFLCFTVAGCATFGFGPKPSGVDNSTSGWAAMTPEQKSTVMLQQYLTFSKSARLLAAKPNKTEGEKKLIHIEKQVLLKLKPVVLAYDDAYVKGDPMAMANMEIQFLELLNEWLLAQIGGK